MKFTRKDIDKMDKVYRLNLINSITGFKSANLIGTNNGSDHNLAVFSSVTHYGSNPPVVGLTMRPTTVPRNTYSNIKSTGFYTINHVNENIVAKAHKTSGKFPAGVSEFIECELTPEETDFGAPFVKESAIKFGMKFCEEHHIKVNGTILVLGEIVEVHISESLVQSNGSLDLNKAQTATISGLDSYHRVEKIATFDYVRI